MVFGKNWRFSFQKIKFNIFFRGLKKKRRNFKTGRWPNIVNLILKKSKSSKWNTLRSLMNCLTWQVEDNEAQRIFFVTPTYTRPVQVADLTRLGQTLLHVENLHWILVEDSLSCSPVVSDLLSRLGAVTWKKLFTFFVFTFSKRLACQYLFKF